MTGLLKNVCFLKDLLLKVYKLTTTQENKSPKSGFPKRKENGKSNEGNKAKPMKKRPRLQCCSAMQLQCDAIGPPPSCNPKASLFAPVPQSATSMTIVLYSQSVDRNV